MIYHPGDSTAVERGESLGLTFGVLACSLIGCLVDGWTNAKMGARRDARIFDWKSRDSWLDALPLLLAGWVFISAWINAGILSESTPELGGDLRASTNEAWWWLAAAAWFVAIRRWMVGANVRFAMVGVILGLGVLLAVHTLHQRFVSFPETLAIYEADPEAQLARVGIDAPPGSAARMIFENRLRDGGPTATFALANSLAGPLAMAGAACLAVLMSLVSFERHRWKSRITSIVVLAPVTLTLLASLAVTGSRSGVLAVAIMCTVLLFRVVVFNSLTMQWLGGRKRIISFFAGFTVLLIGVAVVAADRDSWSQAPATLQLRAQYWSSTLAMVGDHPWFGIGPGNFQLVYQAYRDTRAHELIAEPHNFLMETLASGGWIGGAILMVMLVVGMVGQAAERDSSCDVDDASDNDLRWPILSLAAGSLIGLLWVWYHGILNGSPPDFEAHQWAVPLAIMTGVGWCVWLAPHRTAIDFEQVGWMACGTGLLHLCFSGGWTIPGVAMILAIFAAMATSLHPSPSLKANRLGWKWWATAIVCAGVLWFMWSFSMRPVQQTNLAMKQAEQALQRNRTSVAANVLRDSLVEDSLASEPAIWLAAIENRDLLDRASGTMSERSRSVFSQAVSRIGNDPARLKAIGDLHLHRYQVAGQESDLELAEDVFSLMIELSPTQQAYVAQVAEITREQERLAGNPPYRSLELAKRAESLSEAGGVVTRAINFQLIMPARVFGRRAMKTPVTKPANEVFAGW